MKGVAMKIDTHSINIEIARKKWNAKDLCSHIGWTTAHFHQMMRRESAPLQSIGILAEALGVSPEKIILMKRIEEVHPASRDKPTKKRKFMHIGK